MEKILYFLILSSYFTFQGFIAGCLFEHAQSASDFIKEIKDKVSLTECLVFGPSLLMIIVIKLLKGRIS